ncbi:hypothetical protein GCM10008949_25560 [Deinococcus humi]|nr:hypothetical protein GCM10008949_25560 [Deinococcus humi]
MAPALPVCPSTRKLVAMPASALPSALWALPSHQITKLRFQRVVGAVVVMAQLAGQATLQDRDAVE